MQAMKYIWNYFEVIVANISLAILVIMLALQATARYLLQIGIPWTEEISRFSFIYFVYISASLAMLKASHIKVEILTDRFNLTWRKRIEFIGNLVQIAFFLTATQAGVALISDMLAYPVYSPALLLPLYYIYAVIPFAYFLMAIRLVQRMLTQRSREV